MDSRLVSAGRPICIRRRYRKSNEQKGQTELKESVTETRACAAWSLNNLGLVKLFETSFRLHSEVIYDRLLIHQHRIADAFRYRPSLLSNVEKLRGRIATPPVSDHSVTVDKARIRFTATPTPRTTLPALTRSTSFSNRADIHAFSHTKASRHLVNGSIESNEIDLTQLIRETQPNNAYVRQSTD